MAKPPGINPFLLAHYSATAERLATERAAAENSVERLLRATPREAWPSLRDHSDLRTVGALERLAMMVTHHLNRDPKYALDIAQLAVSVAQSLPPDTYPTVVLVQLHAHALKDLGKAYRTLNRHDQAIEAFKEAGDLLEPHPTLDHDLALMRLHLAFSYQEVERFNEAFSLIRESKRSFAVHGDKRMVLISGVTEAALLHRLARFREAREAYLLLLASAKPDLETTAALHKNIGLCCIELGDYVEAESNLTESIRLYTNELGQPIEALRAQSGYGRLLIRTGQIEQGIAKLKPIRRAFLGQSMPEEAGICALEIIEGLLSRNKPEAAERLARMVIGEFTKARLNKRAITALGYLSRAIAEKNATVPLVHNVRDYILSLRTNPEREFIRWKTFRGSEQ